MADLYDCSVSTQLLSGMRLARAAIARGELAVIPTDTVYGVAADAFQPRAVQRLLDAKGRTRQSPPPVLIPGSPTLDALAVGIPDSARQLVDAFWPGGLTLILKATPSLAWDLGETGGTVALRMPDDPIALELLADTGPLAVSSANLTGQPAATTAQQALAMLEDSVTVYLDGGERPEAVASTIVDATRADGTLRVVRHGAVSDERLREIVGELLLPDAGSPASGSPAPGTPAPRTSGPGA
ncbi:L-threonylcarbamoyladenylate synthase [Herbiconiux sp. CPCC 205716]|uniref:L-threonylcarbamoyladenylate synthase n=1 Tax=Herbiconiux gentiana TaxID=2970912 RepID=A0ABT2GFR4_9MICO|nr:L-threonylcarbamoyladenylate synthase [Herbiconiux gentiana]MCS5715055.1 L-threonylcarbamoyladenylate synthase [Herbiconiux gentiana]